MTFLQRTIRAAWLVAAALFVAALVAASGRKSCLFWGECFGGWA